ncbi:hypothetical protein PACTADRAFT_47464 [Pachysolen tannophilus NRRL Y-2460]|uniref:Uncharacterized protein n=1 Tax=Pachysolen tannophilus NRRL Y-2460 TaxID=669874 RepID=A0A1E4U0P7_PACTA|nr:hypothetical protein PACTADRAFT_47464 [Pachysolen tannophilus NRRL Y-2460]
MANIQVPEWAEAQHKTFLRWINSKLPARKVENLAKDLSDGVVLIELLSVISRNHTDLKIRPIYENPKLGIQCVENINYALEFIKFNNSINLYNIGAEDIQEGNLKLILGLVWSLILQFSMINHKNSLASSRKAELLLWCQSCTKNHSNVNVENFTTSWNDGLALCAIIHRYKPELLNFESLNPTNNLSNIQQALNIATNELGIPQLLDCEDLAKEIPDEKTVVSYLIEWYNKFHDMEHMEVEKQKSSEKIEKFIGIAMSVLDLQNNYEKRARCLIHELNLQISKWQSKIECHTSKGDYGDYQTILAEKNNFNKIYKNNLKRKWLKEKSELIILLNNVKTKLLTYCLHPYDPPENLTTKFIDCLWLKLSELELQVSKSINKELQEIQKTMCENFASLSMDINVKINKLYSQLENLNSNLEDQLEMISQLSEDLKLLEKPLKSISALNEKCIASNIEDNDLYNASTYDELRYECSLLKNLVVEKLSFIENQFSARNNLPENDNNNLTPLQIEEFEIIFKKFDHGKKNHLNYGEFAESLKTIGFELALEEVQEIFDIYKHSDEREMGIGFGSFINVINDLINDDNNYMSANEAMKCFEELSQGKPYITEFDLKNSKISQNIIEAIEDHFPRYSGSSSSSSSSSSSGGGGRSKRSSLKTVNGIHSSTTSKDESLSSQASNDLENGVNEEMERSYDFYQFVNEVSGLSLSCEGESLDNVSIVSYNSSGKGNASLKDQHHDNLEVCNEQAILNNL